MAWEWVDEWKSTNSLPSLVRVALALGKTAQRGQAQDVVVNVIALPAAAVPPDWQMPGLMGGGIPPGGRLPPGGRGLPPNSGLPPGGGRQTLPGMRLQ